MYFKNPLLKSEYYQLQSFCFKNPLLLSRYYQLQVRSSEYVTLKLSLYFKNPFLKSEYYELQHRLNDCKAHWKNVNFSLPVPLPL